MLVWRYPSLEVLYVSWNEAIRLCYELAEKILKSNNDFDAIVAISRGGLIPARIVSDTLGIYDLYVIDSRFWGIGGTIYPEPLMNVPQTLNVNDKNVLIVDEVVDTGKTMCKTIEVLKKFGAKEIKTATLHYKVRSIIVPDFYVKKLEKWVWIFYPWSLCETLYSLAKSRNKGNVFNTALNIIEELKISDVPMSSEGLRSSLITYVKRGL